MLAMRLAHEAGNEDVTEVRAKMAELARRYPGSLREIDELELAEIRSRIDALDSALRGETEQAEWMVAMGLFHRLMRGALAAKRWLAGRKRVDEATEQAFAAATLPFAEDASAWAGALTHLASPPGGRISHLVFERIARHLGINEATARRLVFPRVTPRHRPPGR
jgi:hypothetical protein